MDAGGLSKHGSILGALSAILVSSPRNIVPCRICEAGIPKGEKCFAWVARSPRPLNIKVSGPTPYASTGARWFVHFSCLLDALGDLAKGMPSGCAHCGADVDLEMVRNRDNIIRVCGDCIRMYPKTCMSCSHRVSFNDSSITVEPIENDDMWGPTPSPHGQVGVVCDGCSISYGIETVNGRRARHGRERREREMIRQAAEGAAEWFDEDA